MQLFVKLGPVCSRHRRSVLEGYENEGEDSYSFELLLLSPILAAAKTKSNFGLS